MSFKVEPTGFSSGPYIEYEGNGRIKELFIKKFALRSQADERCHLLKWGDRVRNRLQRRKEVRSWVVMPVVWIRKVFVFPTVEAGLFRRKDQ